MSQRALHAAAQSHRRSLSMLRRVVIPCRAIVQCLHQERSPLLHRATVPRSLWQLHNFLPFSSLPLRQDEYHNSESDTESIGPETTVGSTTSSLESEQRFSTSARTVQPVLRSAVYRMRVEELRHALRTRGLDTSGTKKQLLPRLLDDIPFKLRTTRPGKRRRRLVTDFSPPHGLFSSVVAVLDEPPCDDFVRLLATAGRFPDQPDPLVNSERTFILQVKGLASFQSGGAGLGIVLFDPCDESFRWEAQTYLPGILGCFEAEYSAIIMALRYATQLGVTRVVIETNNEVVQRQVTGVYEVKRHSLRALFWIIMGIKEELQEFAVHLVPPSDSDCATFLARKAMITGKFPNMVEAADPMISASENRTALVNEGNSRTACGHQVSIDPSSTYLLQFDGGARVRPAPACIAGAGIAIFDGNGTEIWCGWAPLAPMSNNAAEYCALVLGLRCARSLGIRNLEVEGDSALIIKQLNGQYVVRDSTLKRLWETAKEAVADLGTVTLRHVPRSKNKRADYLANLAMDDGSSYGFVECRDSVSV